MNSTNCRPLIIAHRGASGYLPEHTLPAYALAVFQGADYIEPDLVMTRDGALIARHDNRLELTTDITSRPEFAGRRRPGALPGDHEPGWFSEDFTLAEIRQLRATERLPDVRTANTRFDGQFQVPALEDVIGLVRALEPVAGRRIGLYPEIKHPGFFAALGLDPGPVLIGALHAAGYRSAAEPVLIQSFEPDSLRALRELTALRLIQLISRRMADAVSVADGLSGQVIIKPAGLRSIAGYACGIGIDKRLLLAPDAGGGLEPGDASELVEDAHAAGLCVHAYTFRAENAFLPPAFRSSDDPKAFGRLASELAVYRSLGVSGFFIDQPDRWME